ncbi:MAG: hypothetical protein A2156_07690 [Deltaproteobacteria bacterium RBG_16_48_10]|nr:MAG: hypothetical protein A2156_07690 [Deltaproteobacteria bacterium RBG_16_48_10]
MDKTVFVKVAIIVFAVLGVILFLLGIQRVWRRRVMTGSLEGLVGLLLLAIAALVVAISINLYTYDRLTHESPVAEVRFQGIEPQHFWADVMIKNNTKTLDLRGDEWQIDARVLKWHGTAVLIGFDTLYRLDRLSGRYWDLSKEKTGPRTVYSLSEEPGLDLWMIAKRYARWIPWVDAVYGSATYMPMVDGAHYTVSVSSSGLLARPANNIARKAVGDWP